MKYLVITMLFAVSCSKGISKKENSPSSIIPSAEDSKQQEPEDDNRSPRDRQPPFVSLNGYECLDLETTNIVTNEFEDNNDRTTYRVKIPTDLSDQIIVNLQRRALDTEVEVYQFWNVIDKELSYELNNLLLESYITLIRSDFLRIREDIAYAFFYILNHYHQQMQVIVESDRYRTIITFDDWPNEILKVQPCFSFNRTLFSYPRELISSDQVTAHIICEKKNILKTQKKIEIKVLDNNELFFSYYKNDDIKVSDRYSAQKLKRKHFLGTTTYKLRDQGVKLKLKFRGPKFKDSSHIDVNKLHFSFKGFGKYFFGRGLKCKAYKNIFFR